jgi:hypothetical protein
MRSTRTAAAVAAVLSLLGAAMARAEPLWDCVREALEQLPKPDEKPDPKAKLGLLESKCSAPQKQIVNLVVKSLGGVIARLKMGISILQRALGPGKPPPAAERVNDLGKLRNVISNGMDLLGVVWGRPASILGHLEKAGVTADAVKRALAGLEVQPGTIAWLVAVSRDADVFAKAVDAYQKSLSEAMSQMNLQFLQLQ